jgi:N-acetylglutamate synthase-like GNAT family acetyltransferase
MVDALMQEFVIRRDLRPGDAAAIPVLHDRIYAAEYGLDKRSQAYVERAVQQALERGWPDRGGAAWLVERDRELLGSLALTPERERVGAVRWFVLSPELRGRGLGRSLFDELLAEARASGLERIELGTFSLLTTAASIYRSAGFQVVAEHQSDDWGPTLTMQRYELRLTS